MLGKKIKLLTITLLTLLSTVSLSAAKNVSYNATVCGDAAYLFGCTAYTTSGSHSETYGDSTVTLHLLFATPKSVQYTATVEPNQRYLFGCQVIEAGSVETEKVNVAQDVLTSAAGCDSTVHLTLKVASAHRDTVRYQYEAEIDDATDLYLLGCKVVRYTDNTSHTFSDTIPVTATKDSIIFVTLKLKVAPVRDTVRYQYEAKVEDSDLYLFGCKVLSLGGIKTASDTLSAGDHDSIITVTLAQAHRDTVRYQYEAKVEDSDLYLFGCKVLSWDGIRTASDTLSAGDHDSIITVTLAQKQKPVVKVQYSAEIEVEDIYLLGCSTYQFADAGPQILSDTIYLADKDSITFVNLTVTGGGGVKKDTIVTYPATIKQTETYLFGCRLLTDPGEYNDTLPRANVIGDSIIILKLAWEEERDTVRYQYEAKVEDSDLYLFGCQVLSLGGINTASDTLNAGDHDSIITVTLVPSHRDTVRYEYTAKMDKDEDLYLFGCEVLSLTAPYQNTASDTIRVSDTKDSIITVTLERKCPTELVSEDTIAYVCFDKTFDWHGHLGLDKDTVIADTLKGAAVTGCDSVVVLHLTKLPAPTNEEETVYACVLPITWRGQDYDEYTTYIVPEGYKDPDKGCDSVIHVLHLLQYDDPTDEEETMSPCVLPITWRGIECTEYKDYTVTEQYKGSTCDSVNHILHLIKPEPVKGTVDSTVCGAESVEWHGHILTTDTVISDTLYGGSIAGCDSVITLTLKLYPASVEDKDTVEVCTLPYTWRGQELNKYGDHHDLELWPGSECVKIEYSLHLAKPEAIVKEEVEFVCEADLPFVWHGHSLLRDTANCDDTLKTVLGCDSIVRLTLTVDRKQDSIENVLMCPGESYTWKVDGKEVGTYDKAGSYEHTLLNVRGCDSLHITLTLDVNAPKPDTLLFDTVCARSSYDWVIDGRIVGTYTEAGDYTYDSLFVKPSYSGTRCDFRHYTLRLFVDTIADDNIHHLPDTVVFKGYTFEWRDHQEYVITQDTSFRYVIRNHRGCDSVLYTQNVIYNSYIARAEVDVEDVSCYEGVYHGRVSDIKVVSDTAWTDSVRVWVKDAPVDSIYHYTVYVLELPSKLPETLLDSLRAICGMRIDSTIAAVEKDIQDYVAADPHLEAKTIQWFVKKGGQFAPMVGSDIITGAMESVEIRCVVADRCGHEVAIEKSVPVEDPAPHKGATLNGKYGQWLIVLHVNNLLKEQLQFTEEDIDWYQEVDGVETKLDYHGYYYTIDKEMIGKFRVVIHAQSASGCNETIESNTIDWSTPYRAALKLVPNIGHEGTNMRLLNLDPEKEYIVYAYDEAGALIYRTTVSGQAILDFKATGRQGLYMLRVDNGDKSETLRYIIK